MTNQSEAVVRPPWRIAFLLFGSGFCALVYQTVWLRQFRLIFGASTPASAAVLALFMAGLGIGGLVWGPRAERARRPLLLYAYLELGVAGSAALSPFVLDVVRFLYAQSGGTSVLGPVGATAVRLVLASVVLGVPVVLMGGTLPAAGRAAVAAHDAGRRGIAVLYGANTAGAVIGTLVTTFLLFEVYGVELTLWIACLINALVFVAARALSRRTDVANVADVAPVETDARRIQETSPQPSGTRRTLLLSGAFVAGFVFFLVELVWYRMTGPILGGSTYTFGLVLALALVGIGSGSALYAFAPPRAPSLGHLALTFALESVFLMLPFACGDSLAHLAFFLTEFGQPGFERLVFGWSLVAGLIVIPAATVSGYQFPLLLSLKGEGRQELATDVAKVYAANTVGSILGSIAGGFGLLPLLTAPGTWRLAGALLAVAAIVLALASLRTTRLLGLVGVGCASLGFVFVQAKGPSSLWRHTGIGAGRALLHTKSRLEWRQRLDEESRFLLEEHEGRESSVAFTTSDGLSFVVNGKVDGNAVGDARTTIGLGLIPAIMHHAPKSAFVIGLGTGQTAGWLAALPGMERVDVVEIEPAVTRLAALCGASNQGLLDNSKARVIIGDGREVLTTTRHGYDIIVSEPSNPYRAGVASFYTEEFYREVEARLSNNGVFGQWVQGYEVESSTIALVLSTMQRVFANVSIWQIGYGDFLLVATRDAQFLDVEEIRQRLASPVFQEAFQRVFGVYDPEGFLALHLASPAAARIIAQREQQTNRDGFPILEYRFAESLGKASPGSSPSELHRAAAAMGMGESEIRGPVDPDRVETVRRRLQQIPGSRATYPEPNENAAEAAFWEAYQANDLARAASLVERVTPAAHDGWERIAVAEVRAAQQLTDSARESLEAELADLEKEGMQADPALVRALAQRTAGPDAAFVQAAQRAIVAAQEDPWTSNALLIRFLTVLGQIREPAHAQELAAALLERSFASYRAERERQHIARILISRSMAGTITPLCLKAFAGPPEWAPPELRARIRCFEQHAPSLVADAVADLRFALADESASWTELLSAPTPDEP